MKSLKIVFLSVVGLIFAASLSACGSVQGKQEYPKSQYDKDKERFGSILESKDDGGFTLWDSKDRKRQYADAMMGGANGYLWRAALDTIGFMPLASSDSRGGVILTDWYTPPSSPNERLKLNVLIKDHTLRADGVKVSVFRQTKSEGKNTPIGWVDAPANPNTASQIEDAILQRARQLKQQAGQSAADKAENDTEASNTSDE